jgi:hypothetical protein
MGLNKPPDDRPKSGSAKSAQTPSVNKSVNLKIPDKEMYIMNVNEKAPTGNGTCSCNSVCTCVPVESCTCNMVCTCDSVCSTNTCACNPFAGCTGHACTCVPVCSTCTTCTTGCSCIPVTYYYIIHIKSNI